MSESIKSPVDKSGSLKNQSRLRGSLLSDYTTSDQAILYGHPDIFRELQIAPVEEPERITYEFPSVGVVSLLKIDNYDGRQVLQVDIAEVDDDKLGQGFGTDMYRYVAAHLPVGYEGILSGTITHEAIHRIYETLGAEPGFLLHRVGEGLKPSLYFLEVTERNLSGSC